MANQPEIMGIFSHLATGKVPVRLYNTYRGLPFNHYAEILGVEQDTVTARVHRHQAVGMATEGRTHLEVKPFPEVMCANVVELDFRKKQAILSEFTGVGDAVGKRTNVRVQPGEPLEAQITDGRRWVRGRIANISASGMCIFTYTTSMYCLAFGLDRLDHEVFVDFKPPRFDCMVRFMGVITNIREQEGSCLHRLGLRIFPNPEVQPLLDDYIAWQQQAIMREVELAYHSMCHENTRQADGCRLITSN